MKRLVAGLVALGLVSLGVTAVARAQNVHFGIGGGLTKPLSSYADADNSGWHVMGKLDLGIPVSPWSVRVDGLFGQTNHQSSLDGHTQVMGGLANLVWHIPTAAPIVKPYLLAGGGVYNLKLTIPSLSVDSSTTKFTWDGGAGVAFGAGPVHLFVEGRYISIQETGGATKFMPFTAGVTFGSK